MTSHEVRQELKQGRVLFSDLRGGVSDIWVTAFACLGISGERVAAACVWGRASEAAVDRDSAHQSKWGLPNSVPSTVCFEEFLKETTVSRKDWLVGIDDLFRPVLRIWEV